MCSSLFLLVYCLFFFFFFLCQHRLDSVLFSLYSLDLTPVRGQRLMLCSCRMESPAETALHSKSVCQQLTLPHHHHDAPSCFLSALFSSIASAIPHLVLFSDLSLSYSSPLSCPSLFSYCLTSPSLASLPTFLFSYDSPMSPYSLSPCLISPISLLLFTVISAQTGTARQWKWSLGSWSCCYSGKYGTARHGIGIVFLILAAKYPFDFLGFYIYALNYGNCLYLQTFQDLRLG